MSNAAECYVDMEMYTICKNVRTVTVVLKDMLQQMKFLWSNPKNTKVLCPYIGIGIRFKKKQQLAPDTWQLCGNSIL